MNRNLIRLAQLGLLQKNFDGNESLEGIQSTTNEIEEENRENLV